MITNLKCPFSGMPIVAWKTGIGWFATSDFRDSGWASVLYPTEADLMRALTERTPAGVSLPAESTIWSCPFSGRAIEIRENGNMFEAVVNNKWVSRPMVDRRRLEYMISTRGGIPPVFNSSVKIEVRERVPPAVTQALPAPEVSGNVREYVEEVVSAMDTKHTVVVDGLRESGRLRGKRPVK